MDFKFTKDSNGFQPQPAPSEKKRQTALLLLLLILVGGFSYLYFFTGLIKPLEAEKAAEPVVTAQQVVRMPLPPRKDEPAAPHGKVPGKSETPKTEAATPVAAIPSAKPAIVPATPAPAPAAKPAPAPVKPKEEPKKADTAKPADKGQQKMQVADKKIDKGAVKAAEKATSDHAVKPVIADNKSTPAKASKKKTGPAVAAAKASADSWTLVVGTYILEEPLSVDIGRVTKAGFEPVVKPSDRKLTAMNRLFVSEFNDRGAALSIVEKLKRFTSDVFVIEHGGKFAVYAGSYLQNEAACAEKTRLKDAGFEVTVRNVDIAIPAQSLSVGPFKSKSDAQTAVGKLNKAGIKATLSQK